MVSASELAQMGVCERRVYFEARYGKRAPGSRKAAIEHGRQEHDKFFNEGVSVNPNVQASLNKPWCFIASMVYGPAAPETQLLRLFRDRFLRRCVGGRAAVRFYYQWSPKVCEFVRGRAVAVWSVRMCLWPVVRIAAALVNLHRAR
jgi:hypothetical protein